MVERGEIRLDEPTRPYDTALDAAGDGDCVADLVRHRLTGPYHLSWTVLGGGLEASAPPT